MLKRIARENVNVSLTLPASLPFNSEFAPRSATQSVEKSDSVTPPLRLVAYAKRSVFGAESDVPPLFFSWWCACFRSGGEG